MLEIETRACNFIDKHMKLNIGSLAPDFSLSDQQGKVHSLKDNRGQWVLIYFYPKDDTPGCTAEACAIRDLWPEFEKLGVRVLGISTDSVSSHDRFAKKYRFSFPILADEQKEVVKAYGVLVAKNFLGKKFQGTARTSFLIDPQGRIAKIYEKVKPGIHARQVLTDYQNML